MPTFRVVATDERWLEATIEADTLSEAHKIAEAMDLDEFEDTESGALRVDQVVPC